MAVINWTESALLDLDEIAEYIAINNILAAKALVQSVFHRIERLEDFPLSGRSVPELPHLDYREIVLPPCRIFYKVTNDGIVYILYVMREERELRQFVLNDRGLQ
ncbi:type II toxin-antitoxin system RelE/ParE family toxin [Aliivibrio sp. S4TY2]|uniref:type II toxin-antitoxin system RelE/ParE family toxin n=1 Tax=unclassified Aliivibrio TaxID=2645654 RepID=UPI00237838A4|nr:MULTISPECIES: type II toxin-antitoxin system RelE/ParE family toxin [unclassified Aliivibrio]MDD9157621.1 type II toxin-antitoxin system RelE/ParE family toxin [Aliivibrio sp. S4TY2]MDD9161416.1 type II toxin-antitoxin system RelE/ParE family toxin [Aliivibrio sp. S4TY1]MDD9165531.1 type II toxin-antitoxin system RelE/ParE family toxin [Aliivibrio sp. S4MY2]MDD9169445.1 type II toxin-antitoxin system RelE/ParE family toxin [Aliivibrio sp. S4MY4]MDD9186438.1 type II toxin-antitoxin system Re